MSHFDQYDEAYYLRGRESGKSLYDNFRWLPDLTVPMARAIIQHLRMEPFDSVLDFGCARGYVVRAFRELGFNAHGVDCSEWAIRNADLSVADWVGLGTRSPGVFDWVIAKDVLEHVQDVETAVSDLVGSTKKGLLAVVPLSPENGLGYVVPEYELDVTHVHRLTLATWASMFMRAGWAVEARYRLKGVKDNYAKWATGNGFITCRAVK